jgi:uncharacterized protein
VAVPVFKYHPDPLSTGSMKASGATCDCCGQARGYEYTASFYTPRRPKPTLCPWCISNGDAAKKYEGQFSDDYPLQRALLPEGIIAEVCERTPGYSSWQQEVWQSHCNDACAFHGDAEPGELQSLTGNALSALLLSNGIKERHWQPFLDGYEKGGNPAMYKFVCRHCQVAIYKLDFT